MNKHNSFLPGMLEDQGAVQQSKNFCDTATSKADQSIQSFRHDPFAGLFLGTGSSSV